MVAHAACLLALAAMVNGQAELLGQRQQRAVRSRAPAVGAVVLRKECGDVNALTLVRGVLVCRLARARIRVCIRIRTRIQPRDAWLRNE